MAHFAQVDKFNIFRLPVGWQYLQDTLGAPLNTGNLGTYDQLVQACLKTGAHCIIDIHNYARWNGNIIGQAGGPTNDQFADLWSQLAEKYAGEGKVVMGLMNEPHDSTCLFQLPPPPPTPKPSPPPLSTLSNADTSINSAGHQRLGASRPSCRHSHPQSRRHQPTNPPPRDELHVRRGLRLGRLRGGPQRRERHGRHDHETHLRRAQLLRLGRVRHFARVRLQQNLHGLPAPRLLPPDAQPPSPRLRAGRRPIRLVLPHRHLRKRFDFLNENAAVYLGWVGWAAGSFDQSYALSLRPLGADTGSVVAGPDVELVTQCLAGKFHGGGGGSVNGSLAGGTNDTNTTTTGNSPSQGQAGNSTSTPGSNVAPKASITAPLVPGATGTSGQSPFPIQNGTATQPPGRSTGTCSARPNASGTARKRRTRRRTTAGTKTRKMAAAKLA